MKTATAKRETRARLSAGLRGAKTAAIVSPFIGGGEADVVARYRPTLARRGGLAVAVSGQNATAR